MSRRGTKKEIEFLLLWPPRKHAIHAQARHLFPAQLKWATSREERQDLEINVTLKKQNETSNEDRSDGVTPKPETFPSHLSLAPFPNSKLHCTLARPLFEPLTPLVHRPVLLASYLFPCQGVITRWITFTAAETVGPLLVSDTATHSRLALCPSKQHVLLSYSDLYRANAGHTFLGGVGCEACIHQ